MHIVGFEKVFWMLAIPFTVILIVQFILAMFGVGDHHDVDHSTDHDVASFKLLTVRNAVAFFTMFGWTGIAMIHSEYSKVATLVVAFLVGSVMMFAVSLIFIGISKLAQTGNINLKTLVGCQGTVYLTIPIQGFGKVNVNGPTKIIEMKAKAKEEIPTGTLVKVVEIIDDIVTVEKI